MVRLVVRLNQIKFKNTMFQFQYGAIGGYLQGVEGVEIPMFQFQYGAIGGMIYRLILRHR